MNSLCEILLTRPVSHIYVERDLLEEKNSRVERILSQYASAQVIPIGHYKDVFCRTRQNIDLQHRSQSLILARRTGRLLYPGSPVCQAFGETHFFYTSLCMNCIYDCQYCYLRGMYPSPNLVLFVNFEDYVREIDALLRDHPVYLCVSYDTDLCATESLHGYVAAFSELARTRTGLTVEVRTKAACTPLLRQMEPCERLIFAFTLSPEEVVKMEEKTPSLTARLQAVREAIDRGHPVRLCFDPMMLVPAWRTAYARLTDTLGEALGAERLRKVRDFSVGTFRISREYLPSLRRSTDCAAVQYPFVLSEGFYQYQRTPQSLRDSSPFRGAKLHYTPLSPKNPHPFQPRAVYVVMQTGFGQTPRKAATGRAAISS